VFDRAARLLVDFATAVLGVHRIEARASVDNARSNAALRKFGARREGRLRAAFAREGRYVDQNLWAIIAGLDARPSITRTMTLPRSVRAAQR
jgi:ribosomal-protein-serine acetyltransferase